MTAPSDEQMLDIVEPLAPTDPADTAVVVDEPEVIEPEPQPAPAAEVAKVEDHTPTFYTDQLDAGWPHDWHEFKGDKLAIRKPPQATGVALHFASSPYAPEGAADRLSGLLIANILGPESYMRVMWRMMNPDDPDYTVTTVTDLVAEVMKAAAAGWGAEDSEGTDAAE